jgi:hypothetical protein
MRAMELLFYQVVADRVFLLEEQFARNDTGG